VDSSTERKVQRLAPATTILLISDQIRKRGIIFMQEIWKDIDGYEGLYQVSNYGRIKSLHYHMSNRQVILCTRVNSRGYERVGLNKENKKKLFSVHRIVACAFVENPHSKNTVNHIDENKLNNRSDNLEWMTQKENDNYSTRNKRMADSLSKKVIRINESNMIVEVFKNPLEVSNKYSYKIGSVRAKCNRRHWMTNRDRFIYECDLEYYCSYKGIELDVARDRVAEIEAESEPIEDAAI
jgi:hypothetical protein